MKSHNPFGRNYSQKYTYLALARSRRNRRYSRGLTSENYNCASKQIIRVCNENPGRLKLRRVWGKGTRPKNFRVKSKISAKIVNYEFMVRGFRRNNVRNLEIPKLNFDVLLKFSMRHFSLPLSPSAVESLRRTFHCVSPVRDPCSRRTRGGRHFPPYSS